MPEFTPARAKEVSDAITKQWHEDWSLVIGNLMENLGLSRGEVMLFMAIRELGAIRAMYDEGAKRSAPVLEKQERLIDQCSKEMCDGDWKHDA